jgi:hypothetical protein
LSVGPDLVCIEPALIRRYLFDLLFSQLIALQTVETGARLQLLAGKQGGQTQGHGLPQ